MASLAHRLKLPAWYQATRPRVFTAAFVPMGVAGVIALDDGVFDLVAFVLALLGTMLLQTAANLVNEYADFKRGADEFKEAGQGMAIKEHILSPAAIRNGAIFTVVVGSLIGLYLLSQSGPLLWWIGIGGVLVAITYTAGPFPLAYHGLGELAAGIFMGPMIVVGAYYVMFPEVSDARLWELVWLSFPVMFMVANILHANNIRDMDADRAVNKHTMAVIFGRRVARWEFMFLIVATYVSQVILILLNLMPLPTLFTLLTIPEARRLIHIFNTSTDVPMMHQAQGRTAKLHGQYGLFLVIGWLIQIGLQAVAG